MVLPHIVKETLARVRGKYSGNLKTPDSELTLEYTTLQSEAKDEKVNVMGGTKGEVRTITSGKTMGD